MINKMGLLNGKTVLITGASRGIGKAIAQNFVKEDAIVCAVSRNSEDINKWTELDPKYMNVDAMSVDVSDEASVKRCIMDIKKKIWTFGYIGQ